MRERGLQPKEFELTADRSARQAELYRSCGITVEGVRKIVRERMDKVEGKRGEKYWYVGWEDKEAVYTGSSDSLVKLWETADVGNKRVLTVGGSGEFSQIFIDKQAEAVDILDVSMAGCFFNELKLVAAKELSYEQYIAMFNVVPAVLDGKDWWEADYLPPMFDVNFYTLVREFLTPQARTYFDLVIGEDHTELFVPDKNDAFSSSGGPVRYRRSHGIDDFKQSVPFLKNQEQYEHLQTQLRNTTSSIFHGDITDPHSVSFGQYDYVYMSNVGYGRPTLDIAKSIVHRGAKRVGFAFRVSDIFYESRSEYIDLNGRVYSSYEEARAVYPDAMNFIQSVDRLCKIGWKEDSLGVALNKTVPLGEGIVFTWKFKDKSADYGSYGEVSMEK